VSVTEPLGYLASLLVLATFCMRDMASLRVLAIASNLAFIGYATLAGLQPILLLHAVLLPMNLWRLLETRRPQS
jgi:CRP/FNR family cyclic AMP-dependent transcriptional regulator